MTYRWSIRFRVAYIGFLVGTLACSDSSSTPTGPAPPASPPASTIRVCAEQSGIDLDVDGCEVWVAENRMRLSNGDCHDFGDVHGYGNVWVDDVAPNCTPPQYQRFEPPWGYHLGGISVTPGETHLFVFELDCVPLPETPTGLLAFGSTGVGCGDSLLVSIDGGQAVSIPSWSKCNSYGCLGGWSRVLELSAGEHLLDLVGLPDGSTACPVTQTPCGGDNSSFTYSIRVDYGKTANLALIMACPW